MDWNPTGDLVSSDLLLSVIHNYWIYLNLYLADYGKETFMKHFRYAPVESTLGLRKMRHMSPESFKYQKIRIIRLELKLYLWYSNRKRKLNGVVCGRDVLEEKAVQARG